MFTMKIALIVIFVVLGLARPSVAGLSGVCTYRGRVYGIGESFPAGPGNGCNTCICKGPEMVKCTNKACASSFTSVPATLVCPPLDPGSHGICVQLCDSDEDCSQGQKCCSNGCGMVCQTAVSAVGSKIRKTLSVCRYNGAVYKVGESFPAIDGCNTCGCIAPNDVVCTLEACSQAAIDCPPFKPRVYCFVAPCQFATCPAYPDAKCVDDYCGGCNARFFKNKRDVTERCEKKALPQGFSGCPPDKPLVNCFVAPCKFATCPAYPDAKCVDDYCGGCNARFYNKGVEVTDECARVD